jgi:3-hydroxyisobutyrate dehydrogenase
MGVPMAGRLLDAGYDVRGYDSAPQARERVAGAVETLAEAAAPTVVLMLPDSAAVRQVVVADGLFDALERGAVVIDMSSSQPTETQALAAEAERRGVQLVDAPVSGGVKGAVEGTLTIMAGGSEEQFARCRPLLEAIGGRVLHVGPVGAGHALKALNNLLSGTTLLASAEALLVGRRFGLDPQLMLETINVSTGRSYSTEYKLPEFVLTGTYDAGFALRLMAKDLRIAAGLAEATGTPLELGRLSTEMWERAAREVPAEADHTEIARWLERAVEAEVS